MRRIDSGSGNRQPSGSGPVRRRARVLYVEDEADNYNVVELKLGSRYELLWAKNDAEAIDLLTAHGRELQAILMDIQLQGSQLDGIELTRAIRDIRSDDESESLPVLDVPKQVPIIFVTGCVGKYTREELKSCGGNALVAKPIDFHELSAVLQHFESRP